MIEIGENKNTRTRIHGPKDGSVSGSSPVDTVGEEGNRDSKKEYRVCTPSRTRITKTNIAWRGIYRTQIDTWNNVSYPVSRLDTEMQGFITPHPFTSI